MSIRTLAARTRSTLLCALVLAGRSGAQPTAAAARIAGDYVVQDKDDGMPHTIRVGRAGATYSIQWDANTPTSLLSRGRGAFRVAADTGTRIVFSGEPDAALTLLMISASSDTVRAVRVGPMRRGTSFDGDDWAAARGGALFDSLSVADSLLFDAFFVRCDAEATIAMYATDPEFYHDRDGLKIGVAAMDAFRNNCPRARGVRRAIVPGTVRVYGIAGYGAVQLGRHRFIPSDGSPHTEAKFIQLWQRTPNGWRATRTISIDHRQLPSAPR